MSATILIVVAVAVMPVSEHRGTATYSHTRVGATWPSVTMQRFEDRSSCEHAALPTAAPVGEREAFEQIVVHRIGSRAIERWNDDPDAEYKNSRVEDLRGGWVMHLQWQARAALSAGDAVDARRYRWLRDYHIGDSPESIGLKPAKNPGLDAAIDAAMRKGQL